MHSTLYFLANPVAEAVAKASRKTLFASLITLPLASASVLAQESSSEQLSPDGKDKAALETIEVMGRKLESSYANETFAATKFKSDILDIGQSISIVTKELLQDQGLVRLNDVMPYVAGANEFSVYNDITIRGFRNSDDRRVNGLRTYNDFWTQDVVAHVERVEVIKGPAAVTFGDASPGGVVNVVTKKPLDEQRNSISARLGSFSEKYLAIDTTGPINDKVLYRVNVAREDSDSFRNATFNENTIVAPSLTLLPFDKTRINLDYVYIDNSGVLDRGQPNFAGGQRLGAVPIEVSLTQPGDELSTESHNFTLSLAQQLTDNWSFALAYNTIDYDQKLVEHRTSGFVEGSDSQIYLQYGDRDGKADVTSTSAYFTGLITTGPLEHMLVFGMDTVESENMQSQVGQDNVAIIDLNQPENINQVRDVDSYNLMEPSWSPYGGKLESRGFYIQDQITLGDWQFMLGLRHDDYELTTLGLDDISDDSQLSPRFSALYRLGDDNSVYASWIKGFEPPSASENSPQYGGPFDPQDSELFEIGYKHRVMGGMGLFVASAYQLTKNNAIVWANNPQNPDLNIQRGEEQARGFELEFNGELTESFTLIANYAFNSAKISEDPDPSIEGKRKEGAPKHAATVWGRYTLSESFEIGAGVEYIGERHTFQEGLLLPSYTLVNASVFYTPTDSLQFALQGKNLTDKVHWTGGYYAERLYPGNPRSVSLSVNYQF